MEKPEKMKMESTDGIADNIRKIAELFPQVMTEVEENGVLRKAVNFDKLKQLLSAQDLGGTESYEFTWVGKRAAMMEANTPIRKTLRPCPSESKDWDTTQNLYIEGDNLEVLKLLQENYLGKVKMIYIDPPYNTGGDFIYKDKFTLSTEAYSETAEAVNEDGDRLVKNTDTNGRFHSDWCSMIYTRLLVARNFLADDGVIFISIDENEISNLKSIADEVFGEGNYAGEIIWKNSSKNDQDYISIQHEYIVCYVRNKNVNKGDWLIEKEGTAEIFAAFDKFYQKLGNDWNAIHRAALEWYKGFTESNPVYASKHYSWMDERGVYFPADISGPNAGQYVYDVLHPVTGKVCKAPASGWRYPEETMKERIAQGLVHFGADETTVPNNKTYLKDTLFQSIPSVIYLDGRAASKRLSSLLGGNFFTNPKDEILLSKIIRALQLKDGDIVLDFFSGSGSTAHAVLLHNFLMTEKLRFIMVQIQEDLDETLRGATGGAKSVLKGAIAHLEAQGKPHLLTEIGKERIRLVGDKMRENVESELFSLDDGFRVFKVDDSNMADVYYSAANLTQENLRAQGSNIKPKRNDLDLFFGCILDWGLELSLPYTSEELEGCKVHTYNDGDLVACFADDVPVSVVETIANRHPLRAVFRDSCFADSPAKINVYERFKLLSPDTTVKVI